jgi:tellurite resistance protein TehA-like permease
MQLGAVSRTLFPLTKTLSLVSDAGDILFVFGFFTALLMWGFGLAWLFWGAMAFARARPPFNMGWWSIVFALGVFTGSTITLGEEMGSKFFEILGTVSCFPPTA